MATYSFDKTNKIITVVAPDTEVTIQDLLNNIREYEEDLENLEVFKIANASGKEELGGGVLVGITLTLLDWKIKFEDRTGPSYTLCNVSGGNVVYLNTTTEVYGNPIEPSAFVTVTITASSSATLSDLEAIQYSSFGGGVSVDNINGTAGTDYPLGNQEHPVDNLTDAVTIANVKGFKTIFIRESMTVDSGTILSNFTLQGRSHVNTIITIDTSAVCDGITIENANVTGVLDGGTHITRCSVGSINYVNGHIHDSGLYGTIELGGGKDAVLANCYTIDQDNPTIVDMGGTGQDLAVPNYSGLLNIKNFSDSSGEIGIGLDSGMVVLESTITAGTIVVSGNGMLTDNSTGTADVNVDGLINRELITKTTWDTIWIDVANGTSGTTFPLGTEKHPVDNLSDALLISATENIEKLHIDGSLTVTTGQDISGYTLISDRSLGNVATINSGAITSETYFENLTVAGTMSGSVRYTTCVLGAINNFDGGAKNCLLTNTISITGAGSNYLTACDTYITDPANKVEVSIGTTKLNIIKCRGGFTLTDKTSTSTTAIDLVAGMIDIDATCTAGSIQIGGICEVTDNSGAGCTVVVNSLSHSAISENVWDEPIINHITPDTTGYEALLDAYDGRIYVDTTGGSGTSYPYGTEGTPVSSIAEGLVIAALYGIELLHIGGTITVEATDDVSGYTIIADRSLGNVVTVASGATTNDTYFENVTVSGVMNGSVRYTTSVIGAVTNFDGGAKNCLLTGDITISGSGANYLTDCDVYVTDFTVYRGIALNGYTLNIIKCRGNYEITGKTSTNTTSIDLVSGGVKVASSCTAGTIDINGICEVIDNSSSGCTVNINSMSHTAISENVWDEPLTAALHNEPTSAGKRLRGLTSMVIRNELARGPGTGDNQIQLDVDASTLDGAYDPALVSIIGGTGTGQTRQILDYVGSTRIATVDRKWRVNPDSTSEFSILSHAGREHVNEGLARGGTIDTITLNTSASSVNNAYNGQVIFIRSGAGEDTARRVISYDGTTKIATVGSNFPVTPDTTSAYVILPTGTISHKMISDAMLNSVIADYTTAGSTGELLNIVRKIETNRWKIESNQFKIYDDNGTTVLYTFDLKDSAGDPTEDSPKERNPA